MMVEFDLSTEKFSPIWGPYYNTFDNVWFLPIIPSDRSEFGNGYFGMNLTRNFVEIYDVANLVFWETETNGYNEISFFEKFDYNSDLNFGMDDTLMKLYWFSFDSFYEWDFRQERLNIVTTTLQVAPNWFTYLPE
jgi:hypothetical protein